MLRFGLAALFALQGFVFTAAIATATDALAGSHESTTHTDDVEVRQVGVEQEQDAVANAQRRPTTRERRLAREAVGRPFRSLGGGANAEVLGNLSLF